MFPSSEGSKQRSRLSEPTVRNHHCYLSRGAAASHSSYTHTHTLTHMSSACFFTHGSRKLSQFSCTHISALMRAAGQHVFPPCTHTPVHVYVHMHACGQLPVPCGTTGAQQRGAAARGGVCVHGTRVREKGGLSGPRLGEDCRSQPQVTRSSWSHLEGLAGRSWQSATPALGPQLCRVFLSGSTPATCMHPDTRGSVSGSPHTHGGRLVPRRLDFHKLGQVEKPESSLTPWLA